MIVRMTDVGGKQNNINLSISIVEALVVVVVDDIVRDFLQFLQGHYLVTIPVKQFRTLLHIY